MRVTKKSSQCMFLSLQLMNWTFPTFLKDILICKKVSSVRILKHLNNSLAIHISNCQLNNSMLTFQRCSLWFSLIKASSRITINPSSVNLKAIFRIQISMTIIEVALPNLNKLMPHLLKSIKHGSVSTSKI
jgi:hypothetical protein